MGDSLKEIEDFLNELQGLSPVITGVVGTVLPSSQSALSFASPILSVLTEGVQAVEKLKASGMDHNTAMQTIGTLLTKVGTIFTQASKPQSVVTSTPPTIDFANRSG